jgi:hypothetical protein
MHSAVTSVTALQSVVCHNGFPSREIMPLSARVGELFSLSMKNHLKIVSLAYLEVPIRLF